MIKEKLEHKYKDLTENLTYNETQREQLNVILDKKNEELSSYISECNRLRNVVEMQKVSLNQLERDYNNALSMNLSQSSEGPKPTYTSQYLPSETNEKSLNSYFVVSPPNKFTTDYEKVNKAFASNRNTLSPVNGRHRNSNSNQFSRTE